MEKDYNLDYQVYEKELKLENMYFGVSYKIKLLDIYTEVSKIKNEKDIKIISWYEDYYVQIKMPINNSLVFQLQIIKKSETSKPYLYSKELFMKPIRLYLLNEDYIDIVSGSQFLFISEKYKKHEIALICKKENNEYPFEIFHLLKHLKCNAKIYAFSKKDEMYLVSTEFKKNFKLFPGDFKFESPYEFDKHYSDYFDFYKLYEVKSNFTYLLDNFNNRQIFATQLKSLSINNIYIFFGKGGIGKSITIIQVFKYDYDHTKNGTLYINCKSIYKNFKYNIKTMKKILQDEIIFLFKNEYDTYKKCAQMIENYKPDKSSSFWDIIRQIISFCNNKDKNYYLIFDQYKNKIDQNEELLKINEELKIKNKFCIISCCSLNDKDIRLYKIQKLFGSLNMKKNPDNMTIIEIDYLLDELNYTIDNGGEFDIAFEKCGKNIKNYIALLEEYSIPGRDLKNFLNRKKKNIEKNIFDFYEIKNLEDELLGSISNLFYFSVGTEYEINYLAKIQNYIPFKYFDVIRSENNNEYAEVIYNFELVKDVLNDIYERLILENNSIYHIFRSDKMLDEGALGGIFEKYVIYNMSPKNYEKKKKLFGAFEIGSIQEVIKFVPKINENLNKINMKKEDVKPGTYLFKQKNFNGKGFDVAIIVINENKEATVYLFQISINKSNIYTKTQLNQLVDTFIKYFSLLYTFSLDKDRIYFTYIFDIKHKDELIKKCNSNNMKCIFFKPSIKLFTNKDEINIEKVYNSDDIFVCLGKQLFGKEIEMKNSINKHSCHTILNDLQSNNLIEFLKNKYYKCSKINLIFSNNTDKVGELYKFDEGILLRNIEKEELKIWEKCIKGGARKFKDTMKKLENKENYEEEKNKYGLLIIKKNKMEFFLIFPNGEIISIELLPLKNLEEKIYDLFLIEKL